MRLLQPALGAMLGSLALSGSALAGWSAPQYVSVAPDSIHALAVDAHGDAAVAWANEGSGLAGRYLMSVYVRVLTADGHAATRKLWSSNNGRPLSLSVVVGAGEVTVVWVADNRAHATPVLRAVYGPLIGRWSRPRIIGNDPWERGYPPTRWFGGLAIAPDGEVLLTSNRGAGWSGNEPRGASVAWRAPGHPFGPPQVLRDAPGGALPQFDARGTAYLSGYCNGFVLIARPHTQYFTRRAVLTSRPVQSFSLSLAGAVRGLASWVAGECSFSTEAPNTPGPVFASVLREGRFGHPLMLTPAATQAVYSIAVASPGGATVSWGITTPTASERFSLQIDANGVPGAPQQNTSGTLTLAVDGGGDQLFACAGPIASFPGPPCLTGTFVRPAGGGADQPAPVTFPPSTFAVAAPVGRAAVFAWEPTPPARSPIGFSVWRP